MEDASRDDCVVKMGQASPQSFLLLKAEFSRFWDRFLRNFYLMAFFWELRLQPYLVLYYHDQEVK